MKAKKCLILVMCLTLLISVMTGCGGSDNKDTLASGKKTITINYLTGNATLKNVTFYDYLSGTKKTVSGKITVISGFTAGTNEAVFLYGGNTYAAKVEVSTTGSTIKIYYSDTKYDTYKKK